MKRCKRCGSPETSMPCVVFGPDGVDPGYHEWVEVSAKADPILEQMTSGRITTSRPNIGQKPGYLTAERGMLTETMPEHPTGRLLDSRSKALEEFRNSVRGELRSANPFSPGNIIRECAPICRQIAVTEPKQRKAKKPWDLRGRSPIPYTEEK